MLFVDLRGSSRIGEAKLPYDLLYILNQFFHEMTKALDASNGHYSQFTGDGLMAPYGLNDRVSAVGAANAMRGAREMLACMDQLNSRLRGDLQYPLRIGIGIHFSEAIVGAMGPPGSQFISAVGKTVNICARLQNLTKVYDCRVIVSRHAAGNGRSGCQRARGAKKVVRRDGSINRVLCSEQPCRFAVVTRTFSSDKVHRSGRSFTRAVRGYQLQPTFTTAAFAQTPRQKCMMRRMKQITGSRDSRAYGMPIQGEPGTHSFAWDKAAQYRDIDHGREQLERALSNRSRSIAQNCGANALQR